MNHYPILKIPPKINECLNGGYLVVDGNAVYDPLNAKRNLMKCFSEITQPIIFNNSYIKGISEDNFFRLLVDKSDQTFFYNNLIIKTENHLQNNYLPDITFWEPVDNFILAIEIDEPYSLETGVPTHCIGSDDVRDNYFLSNGWCILRFSEYQVIKYPEECFRYITSVYYNICENLTYKIGYKELRYYPCWTVKEAYSMAYHRLRSIYLKEKIDIRMGEDQFLLFGKFLPL